jgi:hypothetical protein
MDLKIRKYNLIKAIVDCHDIELLAKYEGIFQKVVEANHGISPAVSNINQENIPKNSKEIKGVENT